MTFIRDRVGAMSLTHHIKMKRQQPECVRLRTLRGGDLGLLAPWGLGLIVA
jgi:hypothetical protein